MKVDELIDGYNGRIVLMLAVLLFSQSALVARLWYEQVQKGETHREEISRQSIRKVRLAPVRGRIFSSDNELLTDNVPVHEALFHLHEMRQPRRGRGPSTIEFVLRTLNDTARLIGRSHIVGIEAAERFYDHLRDQRKRQQELTAELAKTENPGTRLELESELQTVRETLAALEQQLTALPQAGGRSLDEEPFDYSQRRREIERHIRVYPALAYTGFEDLEEDELAKLYTAMPGIPGLEISTDMRRIYPLQEAGAHIIGFVGRLSPEDEDEFADYSYFRPEFAGRTGLERRFDQWLDGRGGARLLRVDSLGMYHEELTEGAEPEMGADLILNIDSRAQRIGQRLMAGKKGALVLLDSTSGAVLALVSSPSYDLGRVGERVQLPDGDTTTRYGMMTRDDENKPLQNRCLLGHYNCGSIMKPLIALGALDHGTITPDHIVHCPGYYQIGNTRIRCAARYGHGDIDLRKAIEVSCNTYFISIGIQTGIEQLDDMLASAGIGQPTGLELSVYGDDGLLPSRENKRKVHNQHWTTGDTALISIGQGFVGVSPLQAATYTAAIANGGILFRPRLVKAIRGSDGTIIREMRPEVRSQLEAGPEALEVVRQGMYQVVHGSDPSASTAITEVIELAGKTGTAEVGPRNARTKNTWFVCFGPYEAPRYAMAVMVEDGVSGGRTCAPIARVFFELFLGEERD